MAKDNEGRHIEVVVERLTRKHPELPATTVRETVAHAHRHFDGRRVRDFVPLLVERNAEAELSHAEGIREIPIGVAGGRHRID